MSSVTILGQQNPLRGMNVDLGAEFIGTDFAEVIENLRVRNGYAQARNGYGSALISEIDANAEYRGHFSCTVEGTPTLFVAVRFSGATRVYRTSSFTAWTEITTSPTRFATDGNIGFALIPISRLPLSTDLQKDVDALIFGNGLDANRIYYNSGGAIVEILAEPGYPAISYQVPKPETQHFFAASSGKVEAITDSDFTVANTSGIVNNFSTTGAAFTIAATAAGTEQLTLLFNQVKSYIITAPNISTAAGVGGITVQKEIGMLWTNNRTGGANPFGWGLSNTGVNVIDYIKTIEILALADGATPKAITNAVNNGSGLIRITATGHGYSSNDFVHISGVTGTTEANGTWEITVIDANTFDLNLSTFTNAYVSGGFARKLAYYTLWSASSDALPISQSVTRGDTGSNDGIIYYYPAGALQGLTYFCGYRFSCATPPASTTNNLIGSFTTGVVDSLALYATSWGLYNSFAEGYAVPCQRETQSFESGLPGFQGRLYPYNPPNGVHTAFHVYNDGIDSANVRDVLYYYRSDPEQNEDGTVFLGPFYYLAQNGLQQMEASLLSGALNIKDDNSESASRNTARVAYDETHVIPPNGSIFCFVNDRLYVAGVLSATGGNSQLWVSADRDPLDFSRVVRSDDFGNLTSRSPVYRTFTGEKVNAIRPINTDILGIDSVLLWTDRRLYRLGGYSAAELSRAGIVADKGCNYSGTIATYDNLVFWLDNEGQVRSTNGASISAPLSHRNVASLLSAGVLAQGTAFAGFQRYELFYRAESSGTGNNKALLYDADLGAWVRDAYAIDIRGAVTVDTAPRRRVFVITNRGALYEWDKEGVTTDAGANIAITLKSRILATPWERVRVGRAGVVCADVASGTLSTLRSFRAQENPTGANTPASGSINIDTTFNAAWRVDTITGGTGVPGATGYGPQITFSGTVPGGWNLYEAKIDLSATNDRGASTS